VCWNSIRKGSSTAAYSSGRRHCISTGTTRLTLQARLFAKKMRLICSLLRQPSANTFLCLQHDFKSSSIERQRNHDDPFWCNYVQVRCEKAMTTNWEIDRVEWSKLSADGPTDKVPGAIERLLSATNKEEALSAYWFLDGTVVNSHTIFGIAVPTIDCVITGLPRAAAPAVPHILELLGQIGARSIGPDEPWNNDAALKSACRCALLRGGALFFGYLETLDSASRYLAVDLVYILSFCDHSLKERVCWYLRRANELGGPDDLAKLIRESIVSIERDIS
jgi:hypothetical protein